MLRACALYAVNSVLAIGGVGGLAVGLAGREILENLFTGLIILSSSPFEVGDEVLFSPPSGQVWHFFPRSPILFETHQSWRSLGLVIHMHGSLEVCSAVAGGGGYRGGCGLVSHDNQKL